MQKVESELRQAQEAFSAGETRMDASKQELGRLRRTADNARKETQTAREEVKLSHAAPHQCWCLCCAPQRLASIMLSVHDWNIEQRTQPAAVHMQVWLHVV